MHQGKRFQYFLLFLFVLLVCISTSFLSHSFKGRGCVHGVNPANGSVEELPRHSHVENRIDSLSLLMLDGKPSGGAVGRAIATEIEHFDAIRGPNSTNTLNARTSDVIGNIYSQVRRLDLNCSPDLSHSSGRHSNFMHGNIGVEFVGRMCNNMIQYVHATLQARKLGRGLVKIVNRATDRKFGNNLHEFPRVIWRHRPGETVKANAMCGGDFAQNYLYLRKHRDFVKCLFSPAYRGWHPKHDIRLQYDDVVVHIRDPHGDGEGGRAEFSVPYEYYSGILKKLKVSKVYIVATPALYEHLTVRRLKAEFFAEIYKDTPAGDFSLAVMAPTFIGSFGTFSWMAAFLSESRSAHLPYLSHLTTGAYWCPWHDLFIHDDIRINYHDLANQQNISHENASAVISGNSAFSRSVRERRNPCQDL